MDNQVVISFDENDDRIIADQDGGAVFITPMTPEEVQDMLDKDPSLRSLFEF